MIIVPGRRSAANPESIVLSLPFCVAWIPGSRFTRAPQ
jgi:hypothetical protein